MGTIYDDLERACNDDGTVGGVRISLYEELTALDQVRMKRFGVCKCVDDLYHGYADMLEKYVISPGSPISAEKADGMMAGYILAFNDVLGALIDVNTEQMKELANAQTLMGLSANKLVDLRAEDSREDECDDVSDIQ